MHPSVMDFLRQEVKDSEILGKEVLEVGAQDVNGSPREVVSQMRPKKYIGVDFTAGKGVDLVLDVADLVMYFGIDRFPAVISTEMLEHAKDWRTAVSQMKAVLAPGGILVVTTRSPGFAFHGYPHDYWRFTVGDFFRIFGDMVIEILKPDPLPGHPGVLLKARKDPTLPSVDLSRIDVAGVF